jgi:hypothetical protein
MASADVATDARSPLLPSISVAPEQMNSIYEKMRSTDMNIKLRGYIQYIHLLRSRIVTEHTKAKGVEAVCLELQFKVVELEMERERLSRRLKQSEIDAHTAMCTASAAVRGMTVAMPPFPPALLPAYAALPYVNTNANANANATTTGYPPHTATSSVPLPSKINQTVAQRR